MCSSSDGVMNLSHGFLKLLHLPTCLHSERVPCWNVQSKHVSAVAGDKPEQ